MNDIQPGDVVVCVDGGPWENHLFRHLPMPLVIGRTYRVTKRQHLVLDLAGEEKRFHIQRFRKILPADPEFIERIARIKVGELA